MLFSVVIPTHDRWESLERVLRAYEGQVPRELPFEVIVVDDGSRDETSTRLGSWRPSRYAFRWVSQTNQGPARARNHALEYVRSPLVFFTGDDIEPSPQLLDHHWQAHVAGADEGLAILGQTKWSPRVSMTSTMRHVDGVGAQQFGYFYMKDRAEYDFRHFYTSNISVRKRLLDHESSYFSEEFPAAAWEDTELAYRLLAHGLRIRYCEKAIAFHEHAYGVESFYRRQVKAGRMARVLCRKHPELAVWTGIDRLDRIRLRWLRVDLPRSQLLTAVSNDLDAWRDRALSLAAYFDGLTVEGLDRVLLALFRHAVFEGLCHEQEALSRRVLAAAYLDAIPAAVAQFRADLERARVPYPTRDFERIVQLHHALGGGDQDRDLGQAGSSAFSGTPPQRARLRA